MYSLIANTNRRLLKEAALGMSKHPWRIFSAIKHQKNDWVSSKGDNDSFFLRNGEKLKDIKIGASFSPEMFGLSIGNFNKETSKVEKSLQSLKYIVEELNIKDIRFGMRWNNSVDENGNFNMSFYKVYLDYLSKTDVKICINTGIKVFQWPETHVPSVILNKLDDLPSQKAVIHQDSELARKSSAHVNRVLRYIKNNYPNLVKTIQHENEPFDSFGKDEWTIDKEYLKKEILESLDVFPKTDILLNFGLLFNQELVSDTISDLIKSNPKLKNKFISGADYYPFIPSVPNLKYLGRLDSISFSKILSKDYYGKNKQDAKKIGYKLEITEGQMEQWGKLTHPGNSARAFRFMIKRCTDNILRDGGVIRVWGIEFLTLKVIDKKINKEHLGIIDLIKRINSR